MPLVQCWNVFTNSIFIQIIVNVSIIVTLKNVILYKMYYIRLRFLSYINKIIFHFFECFFCPNMFIISSFFNIFATV